MQTSTDKAILSIGIQAFENIRNKAKNYVYVDKTDKVFELINHHKYVFLSRLHHFGKSLFLNTLETLFSRL